MSKPPTGANLLHKAIEVLDFISLASTPPRLIDIVEATGLTTPTAHRILESLIFERFIRRDEITRTYQLGSRFLQMARGAWEDQDLRSAALPELEKLQVELGYILTVSVLDGDALILIERRANSDAMKGLYRIGSALSIHATASGKAILSAREPDKILTLDLVRMTPNTIIDHAVLKAHLEMAASNHFTVDDEESILGVRGCAAPILNQMGQPLGALAFSGPADAISITRCRAIGPLLAKAAERISWNLGFELPERWNDLAISRGAQEIDRVGSSIAFVGANPVWSKARQGVFWSDRTHPAIRFVGADGSECMFPLPARAHAVVEAKGALLLLLPDGLHRLDLATEALVKIKEFECRDEKSVYITGSCDARGRLWIGTMDRILSRATGRLFRVDEDLSTHCVVDNLLMPMGIAWSPDSSKIYLTDGPKREIYSADFDLASGSIGRLEVFVRLSEDGGRPTGLAVDRQGYLWNTQSEAWRVVRYTPTGNVDHIVELPVSRPLDCGFGGADMKTLYITSTRLGIPERRLKELPLSGALLAHHTQVAGLVGNVAALGINDAMASGYGGRTPR